MLLKKFQHVRVPMPANYKVVKKSSKGQAGCFSRVIKPILNSLFRIRLSAFLFYFIATCLVAWEGNLPVVVNSP